MGDRRERLLPQGVPRYVLGENPPEDGGSALHRGRPPYERLGRKIRFEDFSEGCRHLVLDTYRELWGL